MLIFNLLCVLIFCWLNQEQNPKGIKSARPVLTSHSFINRHTTNKDPNHLRYLQVRVPGIQRNYGWRRPTYWPKTWSRVWTISVGFCFQSNFFAHIAVYAQLTPSLHSMEKEKKLEFIQCVLLACNWTWVRDDVESFVPTLRIGLESLRSRGIIFLFCFMMCALLKFY